MLLIALPLYWQEFGLTAIWQVGVLLSANRFIRLPLTPLIGLFYKRYSRKAGFLIAIMLASLTTLSYAFAQSFVLLLIARCLWGVAWALLRLGGTITVTELSTEQNRGRLVGLYNGLWGLGGLVGMLVGSFFIESISLAFASIAFALLALCGFPLAIGYISGESRTVDPKEKSFKQAFKATGATKSGRIFLSSAASGFVVFGLFATTLSPLIAEREQPSSVVGAATIAGIIQAIRWGWDPFLAPFVGRYLVNATSRRLALLLSLGSLATLFVMLSLPVSFGWLLVLLLVFQLVSTAFITTVDTNATDLAASDDKIVVMTKHTMASDLGAAVGPLASFLLLDYTSLSTVYQLAALLLLLVAIPWVRR